MTKLEQGYLIMGGDFNFVLDLKLDSSKGKANSPASSINVIRKRLYSLQLVDAWWLFYPNKREFTYLLAPHISYSRIDNLFLQTLLS